MRIKGIPEHFLCRESDRWSSGSLLITLLRNFVLGISNKNIALPIFQFKRKNFCNCSWFQTVTKSGNAYACKIARFLFNAHFCTVSAVNAQTCLNCYTNFSKRDKKIEWSECFWRENTSACNAKKKVLALCCYWHERDGISGTVCNGQGFGAVPFWWVWPFLA